MSSEEKKIPEPEKSVTPKSDAPDATPLQMGLVAIGIVILLGYAVSKNNSTQTSSYQTESTPSVHRRNDSIDTFVDEQVEKNWRPMPGGNSKKDAARVTKDIMHAKNWQELDEVIKKHRREGR